METLNKEFFTIILVIGGIILAIMAFIALYNLHRLPKMQKSLENVEKYLKMIAGVDKPGWSCRKCGSMNDSEDVFCTKCGKRQN